MNFKEALFNFVSVLKKMQNKLEDCFEKLHDLNKKIKEEYGEREYQNKKLCRRLNSKKKTYNKPVKPKKCVEARYRTHRTQHRK